MKLYRIEELIDKNNNGEIVITKIKDNENRPLITTKTKKKEKLLLKIEFDSDEYNKLSFKEDGEVNLFESASYIKKEYGIENPILNQNELTKDVLVYEERPYELIGELKYDLFTIYYNYLGKMERIYDTNYIGNIEYEDLNFNNLVESEVKIEPYPPVYKDNNNYPKDYAFNQKILKESELIDGIIYNGLVEDGRIFYDAYLGDVYRTRESEFDGAYKRDSGYDRFLGKGYVTIEDGILEMKINIPKSSHYEVRFKAGNHYNNGTVNKVFIDNVGSYFRTPTNKSLLWFRSILEKYDDDKDEYFEEPPIYLEEGTHTFKFEYDKNFSTKENDINVILLEEVEVPEAKNPFYSKQENYFKVGTRTIVPIKDFYIDNDSYNQGTGKTLETFRIDNRVTNIEEVSSLSDKFSLTTGTIKNSVSLSESGMYDFKILFRRKFNNNQIKNFKQEEAVVNINGKNYIAKVHEDHNNLCTLGLYKRFPEMNIDEYINEVYLRKENDIQITTPDENNFLFDSLIINSNTVKKHSDVNKKALVYPNIKNYYFIYEDYVMTNENNELNNIDSDNDPRSFDSVQLYSNDGIDYYIEEEPIHYALNNFDWKDRKLKYEVHYKNNIQGLEIKVPIESYYLPKLLMIHDDMDFDRYMIFKPYIFESIKYVSDDLSYENYIQKFSKYDAKLVPLQNYTEKLLSEMIYDLGENWKERLLNETVNLDDITFCHIYSRINK
ncbi:hypothetical protein CPT_MarsHill_084 [Staphylococcus phage MarsHill]|nr:hypothetical protein CPT_MarsHill_084 [Staphylococcus phage MarsHill]QQO92739.1 hypothetical protein CPT_Madawaska_084 [Staphylococcus phage Madawaska]